MIGPEDERKRAAARHGLRGVEDDVEQDLLELTLVRVDERRAGRRVAADLDVGLGELEAHEQQGVADDVGQRPARVEAGGRLAELEDAGDDGLELVEFLADDAQVGAARIIGREVQAEAAVEQLEHGQGIADLVGDLGGEQAEGRELLALAEGLLAAEDAGVQPGVLQGDGAKAGEGGGEALGVVVEPVHPAAVDGEGAEGLLLVDERGEEDGVQAGVGRQVGQTMKLGRLDVGELGLPVRVERGSGEAGGEREFAGGRCDRTEGTQGDTTEGAAGRFLQEQGGGLDAQHHARIARDRVEQFLRFELGDEGLARRDEGFELAGLALQVLEEPEATEGAGGLVGERGELREIGRRESVSTVMIEEDDAEDVFIGAQGCGHLALHAGVDRPVASVRGHVGDEHGLGVQGDPAGQTLAGIEGQALGIGERVAGLDLQPVRVGIEQEQRPAVRADGPGDDGQGFLGRRGGREVAGRECGDRVEGFGYRMADTGYRKGLGMRRLFGHGGQL